MFRCSRSIWKTVGITEFYYRESDGGMLLNRFNDFAHLMDEPKLLRGGWGRRSDGKREIHSVLTDFLNERLIQVTASGQAEKNDFLKAKIRPVLAKALLHFSGRGVYRKQAFPQEFHRGGSGGLSGKSYGDKLPAASAGGAG